MARLVRRRRRNAERNSGRTIASPQPVALPLRGYLADAGDGELSTQFAAELTNWRPHRTHIETRETTQEVHPSSTVFRRFPFEFGAASYTVDVTPLQIDAQGTTLSRAFSGDATAGYISGQIVIVGKGGEPVTWNGTAFATSAIVCDTGKDPAEFDGITVHQSRVMLWDTSSDLEFYYGDVGAVTGAFTRFPLSRLGNITGTILTASPMTLSDGEGTNDVFVIFTTSGQIVVYAGNNPGDAGAWEIVGRAQTAPPLGRDAVVSVGGDLWIATAAGVVKVSQAMQEQETSQIAPFSEAVAGDIETLAADTAAEWAMHLTADGQQVILNHRLAGVSRQFVYNFDLRAWHLTDHDIVRFYNLGRNTYFHDTGNAVHCFDRLTRTGALITAVFHTPWMRIGSDRSVTMIKPEIIGAGPMTVTVTVLGDHNQTAFDISQATQTVTLQPDTPADPGGTVSLNEEVGCDAAGEVFQIRVEITASWAKIVNMTAFLQ
ncbi:MAG: hypothetical protein AAGI03_01870 [Pseudomonadota bacterium]